MITISQEQFDRLKNLGYVDLIIDNKPMIFCQGQIFKVKEIEE